MKKTYILTFDYKGAHPNPQAVIAFELGKHLHIDKESIEIRELSDTDTPLLLFQKEGEKTFQAFKPVKGE